MPRDSQNTDLFNIFDQHYRLKRYPNRHPRELRAWDAADTYLLNTLYPILSDVKQLCILNDNFGALTLPLAEFNPICYGDSLMSHRATELNFKSNHILTPFSFEGELEVLMSTHQPPDYVIGRVPKAVSQLIYILSQLHGWVKENTVLMLAGMDKHLSRNQFNQLENYFGPSQYLPGYKKARIWKAKCDKSLTAHTQPDQNVLIAEYQLSLMSLPNVFSRNKLDPGSRFLLNHLARLPTRNKVADMACGNGILGLAYLCINPDSHMTFCDESFQAVASTRANLSTNLPQAQASVYADDGLKRVEPDSLDLVICNPPFHQHHTVSTHIAYSLFKDAYRALRSGGELWIVANRHLGYHVGLKKMFGNCTTETGNRKFVILNSSK